MTLIAITLFSLAVAIGLYLVVLGVRFHRKSLKIGLTHGIVAITAFGFLATQIYQGTTNKYNNSAALFMILALTGGIMLFVLREPKKAPPMVLVAIHACMALIGLLLLVLGYEQ